MGQMLDCCGGAHDGRKASRIKGRSFAYISADGRAFNKSGRGRALYQIRRASSVEVYVACKTGAFLCDGCGAMHERADKCSLCGAGRPARDRAAA